MNLPDCNCPKILAYLFKRFKDGILGHGAISRVADLYHVPRTTVSSMWNWLEQAGIRTLEDALTVGDGRRNNKKAQNTIEKKLSKKFHSQILPLYHYL